ncbi:DUF5686 and carboxypeptidase regulatory-like domain-containing protein [Plebeiibacterium sediminum]|uniref:DUF5686 and carboxypeptidase regulatory-like domain-containing protein n=1 Tax=Plebeiibacterium sediminum TaxID=2992112 RepID=A0AAE3SI63_9BACT|nr:DUF5686 and carboxypeptidase regulatory-like domain-containing protein [Plebeiobacterium sediminum]MCW3788853.1 DUF5686 and carboxypeptidase regulatory-like domain-containing protein [Plebeiobacterium sediminum]
MSKHINSIKLIVFFILLMTGNTVFSQVLSGVVKSNDGESIPFASIYIKEITSGTTTNLEGEYSINLEPGTYQISFQALGFSKVIESITISNKDIVKDIVLRQHDYKIKEVRIYSGNEDPAYGIIRKSISLAPYFLRQVKHYKANVYLKGGFDMNKVPRLFRKQLKEEGVEQGKTYVAESINEIVFNAPDKYIHHVISKRSTIPNDSEEEVLGYLNYSFYDSESDLAISPLSRRALSFYTYRYEGFFEEGDYYINKIKVTPKRKNQKLFEGYIYIVDQLWNLHSVDLVNEQFFGKIRIRQVQSEVKGKAWLPVSHQFDVDVQTFGFNATANYGGSVKYEEVDLDDDLPVPSSLKEAYAAKEENEIIEEEVDSIPLNKNQQKIKDLLAKEDLNNREMLRLSRLMEKENENIEQMGKGLQLESLDSTYKIIRDTIPADSVDWNKIRPIPLSKKEIISLGVSDSLSLAMSGIKQDSVVTEPKDTKSISVVGNIIGGKKYVIKDQEPRITLRHYGILDKESFSFNAVDGWSIQQRFNFRYYFQNEKGSMLYLRPDIKYAINRSAFNWDLHARIDYDNIKHTVFSLDAGMWSKDFNEESGIANFTNAVASLIFKENYKRLYQDDYIKIGAKTDVANALVLTGEIKYQQIHRLENSTNYSLYLPSQNYTANNNINSNFNNSVFESRDGLQLRTSLKYTPKYFYRIDGGRKRMIESDYPTFTLAYEKGVKNILNSQSDYDLIELSIDQELEWSFMYAFNYDIKAGYFYNNSSMHFSNFTHFNTSEIPVSFKDWKRNFNLLHDYKYSTNKWYIEGHLCYSTPYLIVKNIPFLQEKLWNENIYLHHLTQPNLKNYNEVGYGISQIFLMMNIGVFAGFEQFEFTNWQFKISLNLND